MLSYGQNGIAPGATILPRAQNGTVVLCRGPSLGPKWNFRGCRRPSPLCFLGAKMELRRVPHSIPRPKIEQGRVPQSFPRPKGELRRLPESFPRPKMELRRVPQSLARAKMELLCVPQSKMELRPVTQSFLGSKIELQRVPQSFPRPKMELRRVPQSFPGPKMELRRVPQSFPGPNLEPQRVPQSYPVPKLEVQLVRPNQPQRSATKKQEVRTQALCNSRHPPHSLGCVPWSAAEYPVCRANHCPAHDARRGTWTAPLQTDESFSSAPSVPQTVGSRDCEGGGVHYPAPLCRVGGLPVIVLWPLCSARGWGLPAEEGMAVLPPPPTHSSLGPCPSPGRTPSGPI